MFDGRVNEEIFSQVQYAHIPMAVVGIVMKFFQIVISISIGTAAGCIPIVGVINENPYYTSFAVRAFRIYLCLMPPRLHKQDHLHLSAIAIVHTWRVLKPCP